MLIGSNLTHTKEYNLRIVRETIRVFGPLSRAEVARRCELTAQTVSNLVKDLLDLGLVMEVARRQEGRGAPSTTLAINPNGGFSIGLDLDRDHLTGLLVDLSGTVRQSIRHALHFPTPEEALGGMKQTVHDLLDAQGLSLDRIWGLGIGVPGPMHVGENGSYLVNPKAFAGWHNVPIGDWLQQAFRLPVYLANNATAAAIGERWYGAGQHIPTFFYVYMGSGLGGGLVIQGQPFEGTTGNAGELGYLPLGGMVPTPVMRPHVGEHFNLPRLYERLRAEGCEAHTPEDLGALFEAGNTLLADWLEEAAERLSWLLLSVEYLLDPQAVFFGGRLPNNLLQALLAHVSALVPTRRIDDTIAGPQYLVATAGADAAALGVATMPVYELSAPSAQKVLAKRLEETPQPSPVSPAGNGRLSG